MTRLRTIGASVIIALLCGACGETGSTGRGVDSGRDPREPDAGGPEPDAGADAVWLEASIGPIPTAPREESTVCVTIPLPNEVPLLATQVVVTIEDGSHHLIVYRATAEGSPTPEPCTPFIDLLGGGAPLAMAQTHVTDTRMPPGVGMRMAPRQLLRLELHYVNATAGPLDVGGSVRIRAVPDDGRLQTADYAFWGTNDIQVDPRSTGAAEVYLRSPTGGEPLNVFFMQTHTHKLGTLATVHRGTGLGDPEARLLYETTSWEEPELVAMMPHEVFDGTDGLILRCEYDNYTDRTARFGEGVDDEMCFVAMMYYPSRGFSLMIRPGF